MVWLMLGIALLLFDVYCVGYGIKKEDLDVLGGGVTILIISILFFTPLIGGALTYPNLLVHRAEIEALKEEIETIRRCHYQDRVEIVTGQLIGGSLDNIQQSKVLSEYVQMYAKKKALFNRCLMAAQVRKNSKFYFWLGDGMAMSKKVFEIKKL